MAGGARSRWAHRRRRSGGDSDGRAVRSFGTRRREQRAVSNPVARQERSHNRPGGGDGLEADRASTTSKAASRGLPSSSDRAWTDLATDPIRTKTTDNSYMRGMLDLAAAGPSRCLGTPLTHVVSGTGCPENQIHDFHPAIRRAASTGYGHSDGALDVSADGRSAILRVSRGSGH